MLKYFKLRKSFFFLKVSEVHLLLLGPSPMIVTQTNLIQRS